MTVSTPIGIYQLLLMVYVLAVLAINVVTFLISDFYRKKFGQPSPRGGFVVGVALGLALIASLFVPNQADLTVRIVQLGLIVGASLASMFSSLSLYFTMRKTRK